MLATSTKTVTFAISVRAGKFVSTAGELLPAKQRAQVSDGGMLLKWQSQNLLPMPMSLNPQVMMRGVIGSAGQKETECCKELLTQGVAQGSHSAGASCVEPGTCSCQKGYCTVRAATECFHTPDLCQPWHQHVASTLVVVSLACGEACHSGQHRVGHAPS